MNNQETTYKLIGALLVGAAIGATLGILFAPDKGSETRKKLFAKGNDLTEALQKELNDFLKKVEAETHTTAAKAGADITDKITII
jgi:gas vesicle protein